MMGMNIILLHTISHTIRNPRFISNITGKASPIVAANGCTDGFM